MIDNKQKAKIVHASSVHNMYDTRIYYRMCNKLCNTKYDVYLIAQLRSNIKKESNNKVNIFPIPMPKNRAYRMTSSIYQIYQIAKTINGNIYHIHDFELLFVGQILRLAGGIVIYDMHEYIPGAILNKTWIPKKMRHLIAYLARITERLLMQKIFVIFAESSYKKYYPYVTRYAVIKNYPDLEFITKIKRQSKYQKYTIGYIGSVTQNRGSLVILKAISELYKQGINVEFECIGACSKRHYSEIDHSIETNNLTGIRINGYLPFEEGLKKIASCHVGLAVLKPIPNYYESFPTKMFEYMALKLPVIVSDFPINKKIITKYRCGLLVDPIDSRSVTMAIKWIYENPNEAIEMGKRGYDAIKTKLNWNSQLNMLKKIYDELLRENR